MIKEVKKKIIISVASVLLLAAAIGVVPLVQAASKTPGTLSGTGNYGVDGINYSVKIDNTDLSYTGEARIPSVSEITVTDNTEWDNYFKEAKIDYATDLVKKVYISSTDKTEISPVKAGTYWCEISMPKKNDFSMGAVGFSYTISASEFKITSVEYSETDYGSGKSKKPLVIAGKDGKSTPDVTSVTLEIYDESNNTKTLKLDSSQFTVSTQDGTGEKTATIVISNTNGDLKTTKEDDLKYELDYIAAYDLSNLPDEYSVDFANGKNETEYTGQEVQDIELQIKSGSINKTPTTFRTTSTTIKDVGEYNVTLAPRSASEPWDKNSDGVYFTGSYTKKFTVKGKNANDLKLFGIRLGEPEVEIKDKNIKLSYNNGNPVRLEDSYELFVKDSTGARVNCKITYEDNTDVGVATVIITPEANTGYVDSKRIEFLILGDLSFSEYRFKDANFNKSALYYNGNSRFIEIGSGTPKVKSGTLSVTSAQYKLYYQYEKNGEWFPNDNGGYGYDQTTVAGATDGVVWENMATPGTKRVRIIGEGTYAGKEGTLEYTISAVEISNTPNVYGKFNVVVSDSSNIVYNGNAQEPAVEVKYCPSDGDGTTWQTLDGDRDYTVTYSNNVDAGTANIKITGIGAFSGEYNTTFEIKQITVTTIKAVDSEYSENATYYTYSGKPIKPYFKVIASDGSELKVTEGVDYNLKYIDAINSEFGNNNYPSEVGKYSISTYWLNKNISGAATTGEYSINKAKLDPSWFVVNGTNAANEIVWDGSSAMTPGVSPKPGGIITTEDYEVVGTHNNNGQSTTAYVQVKGKGKNFSADTADIYFTILPRSMAQECITATGTAKYKGLKYEVTLNVTDAEASKKSLQLNTDYTVTIRNKKTNELVSQGDDLTKIVLDTAGTYTIEISGKGNYTGNANKSVEIECGTNLADYYLYIPDPRDREQAFAFGDYIELVKTKIQILDKYGVDQSEKFKKSIHLDKLKINYFNLSKYPQGDVTGYTNLVGQIYISAVADTTVDNTIYGETSKIVESDGQLRVGTYYDIVPAKWNTTADYFEVVVNGGNPLVYMPSPLRDDIPDIKVYYDPDGSAGGKGKIELVPGVDYEIRYNTGDVWTTDDTKVVPAYLNSGSHYYKIVGLGNYADSHNVDTRYYNIAKATITNDWIDADDKIDYLSKDRGFKVVYTVTKSDSSTEQTAHDLEAGVDYTLSGPVDDLTTDPAKPERKYTVSTKSGSNYVVDKGTLDVSISITKSNIKETAPYENGFEEAKEGEIYVVWEKSSLDITTHYKAEGDRTPVEPKFTLIYLLKKGDTPAKSDTKELKLGVDYVLAKPAYGQNRTVGENAAANFVRIKGMGGFLETEQEIPCTLYYPLLHSDSDENNKIIFTKTKGNIYPGATIVNDDFNSLTTDDLAAKVVMNYNDGTRSDSAPDGAGGLNMEAVRDYTVEVLTKEKGIGTKKIRVTGTETAPNYFKGSFTFDITTTGDLTNAKVQVGNKTNNEVEFDTRYLSTAPGTEPAKGIPDGLPIKVTLGGKTLREGTDYEIKSVTHPAGLGEGHVDIEGKGEYQGTTVNATYSVVATLNSNKYLKFEIKGNDGTFRNYSGIDNADKTYPYENGTEEQPGVRPEVRLSLVKLNADGSEGETIEIFTGKYFTATDTEPDNDFVVTYSNNQTATKTAGVVLRASDVELSYLRGNKTLNFEIKQTSLTLEQISITYNSAPKYNGRAHDAASIGLEVKDMKCTGDKQLLVPGVDYTLEFEGRDHTNVTNTEILGYIVAKEKGNYTDRREIRITIQPWSFENDEMTNDDVEMTYTGSTITEDEIGPNIVLNQGGEYTRKLAYPTDFKIIGFVNSAGTTLTEKPKDVGEYKLTLEGVGNYTGRMNINYEITPLDLTNATITFKNSDRCPLNSEQMPDCTYDGHAHEPAILVKYQNRDLTQGVDYDVEYADNTNAGIAKVIIKIVGSGTQNYVGIQEKKFKIQPKDITDTTISFSEILEEYPFTGKTVHPGDTMTITDTSIEASVGLFYELRTNAVTTPGVVPDNTDYLITYVSENAAKEASDKVPTCSYAGHVEMTVTGYGNYTGTKKYDYYIGTCIDVAEPVIINSKTEYNGLYQPPVIERVEKNNLVLADDEFTIAAYKGTISKDNAIDITKIVDAGNYIITVAGVPEKGTYTKDPKSQAVYTVEQRSIAASEVSGFDGMYYYTGQQICPKGIIVTDIGLPVSDADYSAKKNVKLTNKKDYEIAEYRNNVNAGKATIVIKGIGNYKGNVYGYFTIDSSNVSGGESYDESSVGTGSISNGKITISATDIKLIYNPSDRNYMSYTGYSVRPGVMIENYSYNISDFYVTVQNSVDPGIATMIISGDGNNFTGSIKLNYTIKADLSKYGKIAPIADQVYTGNAVTPTVTVQVGGVILRDGTDYSLSYVNNTDVGKATVRATASNSKNCFYYGSIQEDFNISNAAGGMQISGYASSYAYTGSPITPEVVVTMNNVPLVKGTDYTVAYKNNTNVGVASITVTGIGKYSGTKTVTFTIGAKNIENCITSQISNQEYTGKTYTPVISVSDAGTGKTLVSGSDYILTYANNTNPGTASVLIQAIGKNYTGTKTVTFKITSAAVTGLKVNKTTNHTATLSWTKQSYADGYQICNKSNRVIGSTTKNSYTVNNLASAKTYSYKVRSYVRNSDGSLSYGDFSSIASGKTLLNTPKLKVDATGNGVVTLRWTKIKKATGYEIYYSTSKNGTYYKLASISKNATRIFYDRGLARGEVYYYTIRAYRNSNGKKIYSNYNTIKKATVR